MIKFVLVDFEGSIPEFLFVTVRLSIFGPFSLSKKSEKVN